MDNAVYTAAATLVLVVSFMIGKRKGALWGVVAALAGLAVVTLALVGLGYGY